MTKPILIKSNTRVDLAGGTLDLWPLYMFLGQATTINMSIDIFTEVEISESLPSSEIQITSLDFNKKWTFSNVEELLSSSEPELKFYQVVIDYLSKTLSKTPSKSQLETRLKTRGFSLVTRSQSPVGGGLGGSSSMMIGVLRAFHQWFGLEMPNDLKLVEVAHHLEARILNTPTGTQDYFPAIRPGIHILKYSANGIQQEILDSSAIEGSFLLAYTGQSHHSGLNNFEVMTRAVQKKSETLAALKELATVAEEMEAALKNKRFDLIPGLFEREYQWRVQLAPAFTSPKIEKIRQLALNAGARGVKICGAGGGGCVLIWVKPENKDEMRQEVGQEVEKEIEREIRQRVKSSCQSEGFQVL